MVKVSKLVTEQHSFDVDGNCPHLASDEDAESSKAATGLNSGSFVKERGFEFLGSCEDPSDKSCVTHSDVVYSDTPQVVKETPVAVVAASECNHCNGGAVPYMDKIVYHNTIEVKRSLVFVAAECSQQEGTPFCSDKVKIESASLKLDSQVYKEESACCFTTDFSSDSLEPVSEPKDPNCDHLNVHCNPLFVSDKCASGIQYGLAATELC